MPSLHSFVVFIARAAEAMARRERFAAYALPLVEPTRQAKQDSNACTQLKRFIHHQYLRAALIALVLALEIRAR